MDGPADEPERTCVGCRSRTERGALIRLVAAPDGTVAVDLAGRLPGRGAWVHGTPPCLAGAVHGVKRRLTLSDAAAIPDRVREAVSASLGDALGIAARAGALVAAGHDAVARAVSAGDVRLLVVAADASPRSVRDLGAAEAVVVPFDRDRLGRLVGKGPRAVLGVKGGPAADRLAVQLRRLVDLG